MWRKKSEQIPVAVDPQALLLVQIIFTQSQNNPKFCIAMVIFDVNATFQRSPGAIFVPETAPTAIWNIWNSYLISIIMTWYDGT